MDTQTAILVAIIGLLGTALIVPAVKKYLFDPKLRLLTTVGIWPTRTMALPVQKLAAIPGLHANENERKILNTFGEESSFIEVRIKNTSTKKITGVTILLEQFALGSFELDSSNVTTRLDGNSIAIGDIAPKHERIIYLWFPNNYSDYPYFLLRKAFQISADELDSAPVKFLAPNYLSEKVRRMREWIFIVCALLAMPIIVAFLLKHIIK